MDCFRFYNIVTNRDIRYQHLIRLQIRYNFLCPNTSYRRDTLTQPVDRVSLLYCSVFIGILYCILFSIYQLSYQNVMLYDS